MAPSLFLLEEEVSNIWILHPIKRCTFFFLLSISFSRPFCADKCPLKIKGCTFTRLSEETVIGFIGGKLVTQQKNVPLSIFFFVRSCSGRWKKSIRHMIIKQNSKSIPNNPKGYRETDSLCNDLRTQQKPTTPQTHTSNFTSWEFPASNFEAPAITATQTHAASQSMRINQLSQGRSIAASAWCWFTAPSQRVKWL